MQTKPKMSNQHFAFKRRFLKKKRSFKLMLKTLLFSLYYRAVAILGLEDKALPEK